MATAIPALPALAAEQGTKAYYKIFGSADCHAIRRDIFSKADPAFLKGLNIESLACDEQCPAPDSQKSQLEPQAQSVAGLTLIHGAAAVSVYDALRRGGVRDASDLLNARPYQNRREYLIEGFIGMRKIVFMAGDSGIGKSPFIYQATLCIATGTPCLGLETKQAAVLYMDFENTREDSGEFIIRPILSALGLPQSLPQWQAWHYVDSPAELETNEIFGIVESWLALPEHKELPKVVVIDPYEAWPGASVKNDEVRGVFKTFRQWQRKYNVTVWLVHHVNKEPTASADRGAMADLATEPKRWMERARGGKALANASDERIGVVEYGQEEGLAVAGYRRGRGNIGPYYFARHLEDAEATHYERASLIQTLASDPLRQPEMEKFKALPDQFTTAQLRQAFGFTCEEANRTLRRWKAQGLITQAKRGLWDKTPGQWCDLCDNAIKSLVLRHIDITMGGDNGQGGCDKREITLITRLSQRHVVCICMNNKDFN